MGILISDLWIMVILTVILMLVKTLMPEISYVMRAALIIGIIGLTIFTIKFFIFLEHYKYAGAFWTLLCDFGCALYLYKGGRSLPFRTQTGVFSKVNNKLVGTMKSGSLNWACPLFETTSVDPYVPNKAADLRQILIQIPETPDLLTSESIKVKLKNISFMVQLHGEIEDVLAIKGGIETIKERIHEAIDEFLIGEVGKLTPNKLDRDKKQTLRTLADELAKEVNQFCIHSHYLYKIPTGSIVLIGDSELELSYYVAAAKKKIAQLEAEATDVASEALMERLRKVGDHLFPNGGATDAEKLIAAQVSLGIVKKDIDEKTFGFDADARKLAMAIVELIRKK